MHYVLSREFLHAKKKKEKILVIGINIRSLFTITLFDYNPRVPVRWKI